MGHWFALYAYTICNQEVEWKIAVSEGHELKKKKTLVDLGNKSLICKRKYKVGSLPFFFLLI